MTYITIAAPWWQSASSDRTSVYNCMFSALPGLVPASRSHSTPASEIPTRASALADPAVVDGSEASFVHSLDPTLPGLYNCACFLRLLVDF